MIIIMVLGLFTLSQFEGAMTLKKENQMYLAYFRGLREARNEKAKKAYKKTLPKKEDNKKSSSSSEKQKKPSSQKYFREERIGWAMGRLNLSSLLKEPHKYPSLESVAIEYVKQLYGTERFFPKNDAVVKDLMTALIKYYKKEDPSTTPFHKVTFSDPKHQKIFYKMVKGTHTYELEGKGYPPFGEMFTFEKSDRPPMNFHYANLSFLSLLLGKQVINDFVELEQKKLEKEPKKSISLIRKPELENFLSHQIFGEKNTVLDLFDFTYRKSNRTPAKYQDPETQITVKVQ